MPADGGAAPAIAPVAPHPGRTTPLMYACSQGDLKQVQRILQQQPTSLYHLDRTSRTPLHYCAGGAIVSVEKTLPPAARLSHCADLLLMAAPDLVHARDQDGFTPLHLAVIAGNVQLVQFLLANGANVKEKDGEMHSVVHWATVCGETAALQAVLAAGAEVSTPDVHGGYPIHYAAQMCGSEKPDLGLQVLHILLSTPGISVPVVDNDGRQPLLWAASAGSARAVLALVRAGAAVEAADKDGLTALHCAASRGHTDTLDTLLTLCGAQTDVIDSNGCTALHYSVTLGHADATALLLSHSADPNLQDRKGRSPAHCGCAKGQLETVRQLHAANANLWLRSARGDLPLHEAAASGRRQLVKWLLDQRPSQVNSRNNDGRGLLHLAALNDNADMCKILLDSGAAINPLLRTSKNIFMTPLDCALQRGFRSTAKFLQLHGGVPANRLNTLRISSEVASNVTSGSQLHIREDITVFGGSSSETEVEDPHKLKDHRGRRKTVRRKLSYKHGRRRSYSGSDREIDKYREKARMKSPNEKSSRRSKSRDSALRKEKIYKSGKQIDIKSDGKQYQKKKRDMDSEESLSETETSPEVKNDKTKTKICESERHRQKSAYKNGTITGLESSKKSIQTDSDRKKSRKSHHDDSSHELSDTEKTKKALLDKEKRKSKKYKDEESREDEQKSKSKTHSSNGEQEIYDQDRLKLEQTSEEQLKQKTSDVEEKKQKKSKRSDISDSDTQKNKMSDTEIRKKRTQKEESTEEKITEEKKLTQSHDKKVLQKQETLRETVTQVEEKLQEQEVAAPVKKEKTDSTESTKEEIDTRVSSAKHKEQTSKSESKSDEIKSSTEETSLKDTKDATIAGQEPAESKHIEDETEQTSKSVQPDQVSLQSKLSEESPSKTIIVEAAVHHPPKGMTSEDVHEELATVVEERKAAIDETVKEEGAKVIEEKVEDKEKNTDKHLIDEPESKQETEGEKREETAQIKSEEPTTQEQKVAEEKKDAKYKDTVASETPDTETIQDGIKVQGGAAVQHEATVQDGIKDTASVQDGTTVQDGATVQDSATVQDIATIQDNATVKDDVTTQDGLKIDHIVSSLKDAENDNKEDETQIADSAKEPQLTIAISKEDKPEDATAITADESSTLETKVTSKTTEPTTTTNESEEQRKEEDSKKELNIDLSLKKFEESAEQNEVSDTNEHENLKSESLADETIDSKHKKYRKKVKISKTKDKDSKDSAVNEEESSSTSRETSSSDSESIKSTKKSKISDAKNGEHKSFKVLHDDVAFEVIKDSPVKEQRRVRKSSKKRAKENERLIESATSSPEMLESVRTRSKSVPRHKDANLTLPSLVEKRPESNLSAPNLSSVYSDNEHKSGSNSEVDDLLSSASRKKRIKKRSRLRVGAKSAGSDYESSNLIDSGFEPSPRSSRIPKRKVMSERGVNMTSVTQQIQSNIRKYHMERKIFQHLLDLKRLQIRSGQANEHVLVKRAIDHYHNSVAASVGAGRYTKKDFTYRSFEQFLYQSLRMLQKSPVDHMKGLPITPDNPLLCTQSTHRCLHATHAYTGIPCAAYLPKMNHHTIPKIGFTPRSSGFLPQINSKGKAVTLELCHGNDKQVISLPADRLDHNKRYYVTFTVKGQDGPSPVDQENTTSHRHAKSV